MMANYHDHKDVIFVKDWFLWLVNCLLEIISNKISYPTKNKKQLTNCKQLVYDVKNGVKEILNSWNTVQEYLFKNLSNCKLSCVKSGNFWFCYAGAIYVEKYDFFVEWLLISQY